MMSRRQALSLVTVPNSWIVMSRICRRWGYGHGASGDGPGAVAPDCADPGLHPDRRREHVGKRPNTGRTAAWASVGRRHLLNSLVHRL